MRQGYVKRLIAVGLSTVATAVLLCTNILSVNAINGEGNVTLGFVGDVNLDENRDLIHNFDSQAEGLEDCISAQLLDKMRGYDVFMLNNEFTYSRRGEPLEGKMYTFRANPERVDIIKQMGTDIVLCANNHVYDYGPDSIVDTLDTLKAAGIDYVGAGHDILEACEVKYFEKNGVKIGYVAASRAEKYQMTPQATDDSAGILRCYDPDKLIEIVSGADKRCDFLVVSVHWGTEESYTLENVQEELGHALVDAGADAIIGTHPHVLQGMEYYKNVPIIYSLGNFWFNGDTLYTGIAELEIDTDTKTLESVSFVPAVQEGFKVRSCIDAAEEEAIYDFVENMSINVTIDEEGYVN